MVRRSASAAKRRSRISSPKSASRSLSTCAFADTLSVDAAYRYSDYDTLTTDTYKFGADWAPIADIKFRGSYQKAVRAANVVELFTAQGFNLFDLDGDPCGEALAGTSDAASDAACLATGVPAAQLRSRRWTARRASTTSCRAATPSWCRKNRRRSTFGIILQPRFLPKLSMSVDYFDIEITDTISTFGSDNTLNACYFQGDADFLRAHQPRPENGNLWRGDGFVEDLNVNIGSLQTTRLRPEPELQRHRDGLVRLVELQPDRHATSTNWSTVPGPGVEAYDCKGLHSGSCLVPNPEWRHHARLGWQTPWSIGPRAHVALLRQRRGVPRRRAADIDYELDAVNYFDLSANWAVTEKTSILLGVNNVLDQDPPITLGRRYDG